MHSFNIYDHIMNYSKCLKNVEKPEKLMPILSAVAATGLAAYFVKRAIHSSKSKKNIKFMKGTEDIPTPAGAVYYLGMYR
jgi:predicted transcriptional regulator